MTFIADISSVKQRELGHFFKAQGKVVPPFPCTLFLHIFIYFDTYKIQTEPLKSLSGRNILHYYQGKVVTPFPCTVFFNILLTHKIQKLSSKKFFRSLYFTLLLYAIFYHFHVPFFTNRAFKKSLGSLCFLLLAIFK